MPEITKSMEPQYQIQFDNLAEKGPVCLGPTTSHLWRSDPRHLGFLLARYKFCAKMLAGRHSVLEVGCGDGFGMKVVLQEVDFVYGVDFDTLFIERSKEQMEHEGLVSSPGRDGRREVLSGQAVIGEVG